MKGTITVRRKGEDPRCVMLHDVPKGSAFIYHGQTYLYPHPMGGMFGNAPRLSSRETEKIAAVRCDTTADIALVLIKATALVVPTECTLDFAG